MKRIEILFLAALLTVGLMGIAPRVEAANWVWVTSTDYAEVRIDASNCRWRNIRTNIDGYHWVLSFWDSYYYPGASNPSKLTEIVSHLLMYRGKDGTLYKATPYFILYDGNGNIIDSMDLSHNFKPCPTDSIDEKEYKAAKRYAP